MRRFKLAVLPILALAAVALIACGKRQQQQQQSLAETQNALTEAYQLLDRGERGRAIRLLQKVIRSEDGNVEARVLLASAYAGDAGIDIYSLHEGFQDVLFTDSLDGVLWPEDKPKEADKRDPLKSGDHSVFEFPDWPDDDKQTPLEKLFFHADYYLNTSRHFLMLLTRFPDVGADKLPRLEKAIQALEPIKDKKDVLFYRLFLRTILIKEFFKLRILKNPAVGSRQWLCSLNVYEFLDQTSWLSEQMVDAGNDYQVLYPEQTSPFKAVYKGLERFYVNMKAAVEAAPPGAETAGLSVQCGKGSK